MSRFKKILIPVISPKNQGKSLTIQSKIVRILNAFTALTAELTTRKKQYSYYRDQLLSFGEGDVEWKALGDIGQFIRGRRFTKNDYVEEGIRVIHYGEIYTRFGFCGGTNCIVGCIRAIAIACASVPSFFARGQWVLHIGD